jgi:hypothetical protein
VTTAPSTSTTESSPAETASASEQQIYAFLKGKGLSDAAAAGVLGNLQVESGFRPTAYNAREGAIGIGQWEGGRRTRLQAYAAAHGGTETDLSIQLGFLWSELTGGYSRVLSLLRSATSPSAAAAIWDVGPGGPNSGTGFENSDGGSTSTRQANAQRIYEQIATGKPLSGGSVTTGNAAGNAAGFDVGDLGTILGGGLGALGLDAAGSVLGGIGALVVKSLFTLGGVALVVVGAGAAARSNISGG